MAGPTFPNADAWFGTVVDLLGCCVFIAGGLWSAERLTSTIWIHVVAVVIGMWSWDWFYSVLRDTFSDSLERRSR